MINLIKYIFKVLKNHFISLLTYESNSLNQDKNFDIDINNTQNTIHNIYVQKSFMTKTELIFFHKLCGLNTERYSIVPQLNLATVIDKVDDSFRNELFRNVDFAIFNKDYSKLLLLIELNDDSHKNIERKKRDLKVKSICDQANIKLITFYTNLPNEKSYVINRVLNEIDMEKNSNYN